MRNKKGISLIVLVITIIVMIILAAAVVVSLNNTGIIGKANTAVSQTNLKQIESLASLAWADAFMDGARTQEALEDAVMDSLKDVDTSKYTIVVTEAGVTVTEGGIAPNEYGFYYDVPYEDRSEEADGYLYYIVCKADNTIEYYERDAETGLSIIGDKVECTYSENKVVIDDEIEFTFSNNGKTLTEKAIDGSYTYTYNYSNEPYRDVYYNEKYYLESGVYLVISSDNTVNFYNTDGECYRTITSAQLSKSSHVFEEIEESTSSSVSGERIEIKEMAAPTQWSVGMDGKTLMDNNGYFYSLIKEGEKAKIRIKCNHLNEVLQMEQGMTWEEWISSSYNTVGAALNSSNYVIVPCSSSDSDKIKFSYSQSKSDMVIPGAIYTINHK